MTIGGRRVDELCRQAALAKISEFQSAPSGSALLLVGETGVGKSTVLVDAAALLAPTCRVVSVPGLRAERNYELSGLTNFLGALAGDPSSRLRLAVPSHPEEPHGLLAAAHELAGKLRDLELPPTVVFIDDLDAMDVRSQTIVTLLAGHLDRANIKIVATATSAGHDVTAPLDCLQRVRLAPLSPNEILELACEWAPNASAATRQILTQYVQGNPQVLREVLGTYAHHQHHADDWLPLPPRSTPAVQAIATNLLAHLDDRQLDLLCTLALAPIAHISALLESHQDTLEILLDLGLLRRRGVTVSLVDPRVRIHLTGQLSPAQRRTRRAELATATRPIDALLSAAYTGSSDPGNAHLRLEAAAHLIRLGRVFEGVEQIERTLIALDNLTDCLPTLILISELLLDVGELDLAERYSAQALRVAADPADQLRLATLQASAQLLSRRPLTHGDPHALVDLYANSDPDGAAHLLTLAAIHRAERWEVEPARALLGPAQARRATLDPAAQQRLAALESAIEAVAGHKVVPGQPLLPRQRTGPGALNLEQPADVLLIQAHAFSLREQYDEARRHFAMVMSRLHDTSPLWRNLAAFGLFTNEVAAGQFRRAREAEDVWRRAAPHSVLATSQFRLVQAWRHYSLGELDRSMENLDASLALASREDSRSGHARALAMRGTVQLLRGNPEDALNDLRQVTTLSAQFRNPVLLRHWSSYIDACLATGRESEANTARRSLEHRLIARPSRWGQVALLRAKAQMAGTAAPQKFSELLKQLGTNESPYELGQTHLAAARALEALGRNAGAQRHRNLARTAFEECGAVAWVEQIAQPSPPSHRDKSLDLLTDEEREITRRVVAGERTRDIAQAMHLGMRTVELRLTGIYRKLGLHSRPELIALMRAADSRAVG